MPATIRVSSRSVLSGGWASGRTSGDLCGLGTLEAVTAAAVPLRAHGVVVGSIVVTEPRGGVFPAEDVRLLSTVATHTAIVLANARFFDLIRRAKEQWEIAFDALSEGIAVVDDSGRIRRANRALAGLLKASVSTIIGKELGPGLLGQGEGLNELLAAARRNERPLPLFARSPVSERTFRVSRPHPELDQSRRRGAGRGRHRSAGVGSQPGPERNWPRSGSSSRASRTSSTTR
jgi:GAF domain-containing protein